MADEKTPETGAEDKAPSMTAKFDRLASGTVDVPVGEETTIAIIPKTFTFTDDSKEFFGNRYKFLAGVRNVPKRLMDHWYFKAHNVTEHDPSQPLPPVSSAEAAQAQADQIISAARAEADRIIAEAVAAAGPAGGASGVKDDLGGQGAADPNAPPPPANGTTGGKKNGK